MLYASSRLTGWSKGLQEGKEREETGGAEETTTIPMGSKSSGEAGRAATSTQSQTRASWEWTALGPSEKSLETPLSWIGSF